MSIHPGADPSSAQPTTYYSAILNRAADILEQTGWQQYGYGKQGQCHCLVGAVGEAMCVPVRQAEDTTEIWAAMKLAARTFNTSRPHEWNDRKSRTKAQVVAALRKAASLAADGALGRQDGQLRDDPSSSILTTKSGNE